jgi:hypothetical protein
MMLCLTYVRIILVSSSSKQRDSIAHLHDLDRDASFCELAFLLT